jgi:hypothetical protein
MPQPVSVPEKTLEHWSSQYITYRYRSNAALWWPASGEDIDVQSLPQLPGKAVQLELKTTTPTSSGLHEVKVDLGQLWEYRQRPLGHQPFYVFPQPNWPGNLKAVATAQGHEVTELAFSRSGRKWWFADWMVVLSAAEVAAVLQPELTAHNCTRRGIRKRLVLFDSTKSVNPTWGPIHRSRAAPKGLIGWLDFWSELEQCGRVEWPQLIRLPARIVQPGVRLPRLQVAEMLQEAAGMLATQWDNNEPLVTLEPDADGSYQITPDVDGNLGEPDEDRPDEIGDHRQIVFLDARVLVRA